MRKKIENSDTRLPNTFRQTEPDIRAYTVDDIQHILKVSRTIVEFIWVDGKRRIKRESFDKWYASQSKYTKVKEIEEVEGYVD